MEYSIFAVSDYYNFASALYRFPGLDKYKAEIGGHMDLHNKMDEKEFFGTAMSQTRTIETASGVKLDVISNPEVNSQMDDPLKESLKLTDTMLADQALMEKEPMLKAYLQLYKMHTEAELSDSMDKYDHYMDQTTNVVGFLMTQFENIPTSEQLETMKNEDPKSYEVAQSIQEYFTAYADCYGTPAPEDIMGTEQLKDLDVAASKKQMDDKYAKLENAAKKFADLDRKDVEQFYKTTKNGNQLGMNLRFVYNDKKNNPQTAASQIGERREQIQKDMSKEEIRILTEYSSQVKGAIKTQFGMGYTIDDVDEPYRTNMKKIEQLHKDCQERLKTGFTDTEEKAGFFKNLGNVTKEYCKQVEGINFEKTDTEDPVRRKQESATSEFLGEFSQMAKCRHGGLYAAMNMSERLEGVEKAKNPEFRKQLTDLYSVMEDTGNGYLFHTNTDRYNKMMNTIKDVIELSGKENLNEAEKKRLGKSYQDLSKVCENYLDSKKKLSKQISDAGEDRFAAAVKILSLVDQEKANTIMNKASDKRRTKVSLQDLEAHNDEKIRKLREKKEKQAAKHAEKRSAEAHEKKQDGVKKK
ncbi:MAG: hypothetical protein J6N53_00510 [Lachnospiraceae bacterium]|nr:hypothetical protein [Lachnospiraceae bacterium]